MVAAQSARAHYRGMAPEPQDAPYRPDPAILNVADWLGDPVEPERFPKTEPRFRNLRWARAVGLASLDEAAWQAHFGRFEPLPDNLPHPLALRYHGHQFRVYNPEIGDGRGFLFAQLRDAGGRLLDFGTKGSGTTPYSRAGDGRLTLKGAVREALATEMLEALGVNTSKTFAFFETGEELVRGDEPSPTRSAVLTRLSHGHIRIGSFQRLLAREERDHMAALVDYCLEHFPGPPPPDEAPARDEPAVRLLHQVVERLADTAAAWMVAGFVHGVLNTDNMNVTGESFDYGPWRFLPRWDPGFTAAYFDRAGLYAFGRQPEAAHWNCGQLAVALRQLAEAPPLIAALDRFGPLYEAALRRRWLWRLGVESKGAEPDRALIVDLEKALHESGEAPQAFFHRMRGLPSGAGTPHESTAAPDGWNDAPPPSLVIDEVERIWDAIAQGNDWSAFEEAIVAIRHYGSLLGPAPEPAGHAD